MTNNEKQLDASKEMLIDKPHTDGWIEWGGGECPVDGDVVVDVKFRAQGQSDLDGDVADNFGWEHFSNGADVVAYRLHKPATQQPVWNGEGLPPVGCECEGKQFAQINWTKFRVVAVENGHVFGFWNDVTSTGLDTMQWEFRPIRTEAERKREDIIDELVSVFISHHGNPKGAEGYRSFATKLYDKVISKKLEAPDDH